MNSELSQLTLAHTTTNHMPDWCPGCGDFGVLMSIKKALVALNRNLYETCIVTGIGCSGKLNHYVNVYGFEGIHGRALPVAAGIRLANNRLTVIAVGGDGDGYGIGMNHTIQAMRRNMDMTYIVHNNHVYGLTKGQYSPTAQHGMKTSSTPFGASETPVNPLKLALASDGISFIARGFAGDIKHLAEIIHAGIAHRGFALIDVLQPCTTFNDINTYEFYKSRVYKLEDDKTFDNTNKIMAFERAEEWDKRIATGILYQNEHIEVYEDSCDAIREKPLVSHNIQHIDISLLLKEYM